MSDRYIGSRQSVAPGALKEAEGGQVVGRFKEVGFGGSFVEDAEAVELHAAAGTVLVSQSQRTQSHRPGDLIWKMTKQNRMRALSHYQISKLASLLTVPQLKKLQ